MGIWSDEKWLVNDPYFHHEPAMKKASRRLSSGGQKISSSLHHKPRQPSEDDGHNDSRKSDRRKDEAEEAVTHPGEKHGPLQKASGAIVRKCMLSVVASVDHISVKDLNAMLIKLKRHREKKLAKRGGSSSDAVVSPTTVGRSGSHSTQKTGAFVTDGLADRHRVAVAKKSVVLRQGAQKAEDLFVEVRQKFHAFLEMRLWKRVWFLFVGVHPWMVIGHLSLERPASTSALMLAAKLFSSFGMSALFFEASGSATGVESHPECVAEGFWARSKRSVIVGIVTSFVGALPVIGVLKLHHRQFVYVPNLDAKTRKRYLRTWFIEDCALWAFGLSYLLLAFFFCVVFLANVVDNDRLQWLVCSSVTLMKQALFLPLVASLALVSYTTIYCWSNPGHVDAIFSELLCEPLPGCEKPAEAGEPSIESPAEEMRASEPPCKPPSNPAVEEDAAREVDARVPAADPPAPPGHPMLLDLLFGCRVSTTRCCAPSERRDSEGGAASDGLVQTTVSIRMDADGEERHGVDSIFHSRARPG